MKIHKWHPLISSSGLLGLMLDNCCFAGCAACKRRRPCKKGVAIYWPQESRGIVWPAAILLTCTMHVGACYSPTFSVGLRIDLSSCLYVRPVVCASWTSAWWYTPLNHRNIIEIHSCSFFPDCSTIYKTMKLIMWSAGNCCHETTWLSLAEKDQDKIIRVLRVSPCQEGFHFRQDLKSLSRTYFQVWCAEAFFLEPVYVMDHLQYSCILWIPIVSSTYVRICTCYSQYCQQFMNSTTRWQSSA